MASCYNAAGDGCCFA